MVEMDRLSESEEGYVEAIYSLIREHGYARVADIAATLDVKPPSVTRMLQRLDEQKFVNYTRYRGVILTPKGKSLAETLARRHQALKEFLIMIGVREKSAERSACEIEHKIDSEIIEKLVKFVEFVESAPKTPPFLEHLKYYHRTGKRPKQCKSESDVEKN
jgi:DtxR family Mn-dependent transcriptional regulator